MQTTYSSAVSCFPRALKNLHIGILDSFSVSLPALVTLLVSHTGKHLFDGVHHNCLALVIMLVEFGEYPIFLCLVLISQFFYLFIEFLQFRVEARVVLLVL